MRTSFMNPNRRKWHVVAFMVAAIPEAFAVWVLLGPQDDTTRYAGAILAHVLAAAVFALAARFQKGKDRHWRFYFLLSAAFVLFLPVIGLVGSFFAMPVANLVLRAKGLASAFEKQTYTTKSGEVIDRADDLQNFVQDEMSIEPILDILNGQDMELKRGAVKLLKNTGTPEAIKLLRKCLSDETMEVRYFAHAALTTLEENFNKRIATQTRAVKAGKKGSSKALGDVYLEYAKSGLNDQSLNDHYLSEARAAYEDALALTPNDPLLNMEYGDICLAEKDYEKAENAFIHAARLEGVQLEASLSLCRLYYERKDFASLAMAVATMDGLADPATDDPESVAQYQFWVKGQ